MRDQDRVAVLARALIDVIDNECESVTSPKVWAAKEAMEAALQSQQDGAQGGEAVAWLHDVVQDDGEPDQALSFSRDSFPLEGVGGFRSVACRPLIYGDTRPAIAPQDDEAFTDWLAHEMPAGTIIGDPRWWARQILRATRYLVTPQATPAAVDAWRDAVQEAKEAELFDDGVEADLHDQGIHGEANAYMAGRQDVIAEIEQIAGEHAATLAAFAPQSAEVNDNAR